LRRVFRRFIRSYLCLVKLSMWCRLALM
jgi:hypothetical protein